MKKLKNLKQKLHIDMETVPVKTVRQPQVDDWYDPKVHGKNIFFRIQTVDLENTDYEFLVLIHALIESYLCYRRGISDKAVSNFDAKHLDVDLDGGPGDLEEAPYHKEHTTATDIEAILSVELGVTWKDYGKAIEKVLKKWKP